MRFRVNVLKVSAGFLVFGCLISTILATIEPTPINIVRAVIHYIIISVCTYCIFSMCKLANETYQLISSQFDELKQLTNEYTNIRLSEDKESIKKYSSLISRKSKTLVIIAEDAILKFGFTKCQRSKIKEFINETIRMANSTS